MKRWTPHPYQLEAVKFLLQNSYAGLFLSPGLGKTSIVLATLAALKSRGMFRRALVVAPRRPAKLVWPAERQKWTDFMGLTIDVLHGTKKQDILERSNADICVVTPDGLDWLCDPTECRLDMLDADVLVVDESSYFRTYNTRRFKNVKTILSLFKRRIILTATPAPSGYENLWSQIYILDRGGSLGPYITHYRMAYFVDVAQGRTYSEWALRGGAEKLINEKIKPLVLREDAIDHLDMPTLIRNVVPVELPPAARKTYDLLETQFCIMLDGRDIIAPNAAVLGGKLRQVANGFAYTNAPGTAQTYTVLHDAKLDALIDFIDDLQGQPVLVLYEFKADRDRIMSVVRGAKDLGAGVSDAEADALCTEFNAGKLAVLLAHPQSAGHGLNLQGQAQHIVWFGPSWNLEHDEQATARVWRQGNPHDRVIVTTFVVKDSIEEGVARALSVKDRTQKALLGALKRQPQDVVVEATAYH